MWRGGLDEDEIGGDEIGDVEDAGDEIDENVKGGDEIDGNGGDEIDENEKHGESERDGFEKYCGGESEKVGYGEDENEQEKDVDKLA